MAHRRRVFRHRPSASQRILRIGGFTLFSLAIVFGLAYVALPWALSWAATHTLTQRGWGPVSLRVTRFDAGGLEIADLALANEAVMVKRVAISYALRDLFDRNLRDVTIAGLRMRGTWDVDGLRIGPVTLGRSTSPGDATPWPGTQRLTIADSVIVVPVGGVTFETAVAADLAAQDERWDGTVGLQTRVAGSAAPILAFRWEGAFAPAEPTKWRSEGALDLAVPDLMLAEGATVSGRGRLQIATGDGRLALTAPDRLAINLSAVGEPLLATLPAAWRKPLAGGAALYLAGSKGGPRIVWTTGPDGPEQEADAELGVSFGEAWLRAIVRGRAQGSLGQVPQTLQSAEARIAMHALPTPVGEVSGRVQVSDMAGPLSSARGRLVSDVSIAQPAMKFARADLIRIAADATLHLNGLTLGLEPQSLSLVADDVALPAWVQLQGRSTAVLIADASRPPRLGLAFGADGATTATVALTMAARAFTVGLPRGTNAPPEPVLADLPRIRIDGYVTFGRSAYDLVIAGNGGAVSHPSADAVIRGFDAQLRATEGTLQTEALVTRLLGRASRTASTAVGPTLKSNVKWTEQRIEIESAVLAASGAKVGQMTGRIGRDRDTGSFTFTTPRLRFGGDGLRSADVLTSAFPATNLSGEIELSAKAGWDGPRQTTSGSFTAAELAFQTAGMAVTGATAKIELTSLSPPRAEAPVEIAATRVVMGVPMTAVALSGALPGDGQLLVSEAGLNLFGGRVSLSNAAVPIDGRPAQVSLNVSRLDLAALAAQGKIEGLSVTGTMSGTLPVRLDRGEWWVTGGKLQSNGPGVLRYRPTTPPAALAGAGETVLKALDNFQYETIAATVTGSLFKELTVTLNMNGKNPDLYGGYPISFNLNLGGPLGAILRQGLVGYGIAADMAERLKRGEGLPPPAASPP